ncbi:MAG: anion permease [Magnetococcales bacterium]|nr:anion permease [Magnetococcales bacterium]
MNTNNDKLSSESILATFGNAEIFQELKLPDLARIVPFMKELHFKKGEQIIAEGTHADKLYMLLEGVVQVDSGRRSMGTVNEGYLGEEAVLDHPEYFYTMTAASDVVKVLSFIGSETSKILEKQVSAKRDFSFSLLRFGLKNKSDVHSKKEPNIVKVDSAKKQKKEVNTFVGWVLAFLSPLILYNLPILSSIGENARIFIAVFAVTILMWVFKLVPDYVAGLLSVLVTLVLGLTPGSVILGGFQSSSFFMALSIFVLASVVVASGVVFRVTLLLLKYTPPSTFFYNLIITLAGLVLTPILPSSNGRVGLITPLLNDLTSSLGFKRQGPDATRLAVSAFFGLSIFSSVFLTSKSINFLVFGMLPLQVQESFQWVDWFLAASVAGLVSLVLVLFISSVAYPPQEKAHISQEHIIQQLSILGKMSKSEWGATIGVGLFILGIVTTSIHKIKPAWIGLALMFLFLALGTMNKKEFKDKIDWPFLFLLGTLIGLARAISHLGIDSLIAAQLGGLMGIMQSNIYLFVLILAGIITLIRFAMSINAAVVISASIFLPLAQSAGLNMWVMGFMILTLAESFIIPYQCSYYVMFQGLNEERKIYSEKSFLKFNLWSFIIRLTAIYASIPFWKATDILK